MTTIRSAHASSPRKKVVKTQDESVEGAGAGARQTTPVSARRTDESARWRERVRGVRMRQASVAAILDETFGRFAESDPSLWDRRTYLMLVGIVYERLAVDEETVSTEELIALAKLLAESRRADTQARERASGQESPDNNGAAAGNNGHLPDAFGDVVRQIYGTALPGAKS